MASCLRGRGLDEPVVIVWSVSSIGALSAPGAFVREAVVASMFKAAVVGLLASVAGPNEGGARTAGVRAPVSRLAACAVKYVARQEHVDM